MSLPQVARAGDHEPTGRTTRSNPPRPGVSTAIRGLLFGLLSGLSLSACTTEPVELQSIRIEGRIYDAESMVGLEGVPITLLYQAGAFGVGSSGSAFTDATGHYVLAVEFDSPKLCETGTYDLGLVIPEGYGPDPDGIEPLECVETAQQRDIKLWPVAEGV